MARAERALGLVGGLEGQAHFLRALELHEATPDSFEQARTQLAYGAVLRRERRRVDARPLLARSPCDVRPARCAPVGRPRRRRVGGHGGDAHRRGHDELDLLTAQEMQIARLLGEGRTTREAAAAMFISPKTVEYHLRHVYTKLSIGSRAELSALVVGRGGL